MVLPQGATARDRWLELADAARANRDDARAAGDHGTAAQWDEHERLLLDNAYGDVPFSDSAAPGSGFNPGGAIPADGDPSGSSWRPTMPRRARPVALPPEVRPAKPSAQPQRSETL